MTLTLEEELEQLIEGSDYRIQLWSGNSGGMKLTLIYLPRLQVRGEGAFAYIANGKVAEEWFFGRRKWQKAAKWVRREIAGHRSLLRTVGQA